MNLTNVTPELAFDLVQYGAWTIHEFQSWHIAKLLEADKAEPKNPILRHFMYGIRYQDGDYSRITSLVFFDERKAQELIDFKNDVLAKEDVPGQYVLETLMLMDTP